MSHRSELLQGAPCEASVKTKMEEVEVLGSIYIFSCRLELHPSVLSPLILQEPGERLLRVRLWDGVEERVKEKRKEETVHRTGCRERVALRGEVL